MGGGEEMQNGMMGTVTEITRKPVYLKMLLLVTCSLEPPLLLPPSPSAPLNAVDRPSKNFHRLLPSESKLLSFLTWTIAITREQAASLPSYSLRHVHTAPRNTSKTNHVSSFPHFKLPNGFPLHTE